MNRETLLTHLSIEVQTLDVWIERDWLVPQRDEADLRFSDTDVARARLILDLTRQFGVNNEGVDIILHLLDQLHGFRRAFEGLGQDLREPR
jgi:chaperone modulatory protein CbpM